MASMQLSDSTNRWPLPLDPTHYTSKLQQWGIEELQINGHEIRGSSKTFKKTAYAGVGALQMLFSPDNPGDEVSGLIEVGYFSLIEKARHVPRLYEALYLPQVELTTLQTHMGQNLEELFLSPFNGVIPSERVLKKILEALADLHAIEMVHGDIKPSNCTPEGLIDFGLSDQLDTQDKTVQGVRYTPLWRPPETVFDDFSVLSSDIWALGCTFFQLVTGVFFFYSSRSSHEPQFKMEFLQTLNDRLELFDELKHKDSFDAQALAPSGLKGHTLSRTLKERLKNYPKGDLLADLIEKMIVYDHTKRISAKEALQHPYFTQNPQDLSFRVSVKKSGDFTLKMRSPWQGDAAFSLTDNHPTCIHVAHSDKPYFFELLDNRGTCVVKGVKPPDELPLEL